MRINAINCNYSTPYARNTKTSKNGLKNDYSGSVSFEAGKKPSKTTVRAVRGTIMTIVGAASGFCLAGPIGAAAGAAALATANTKYFNDDD